MADLEDDISKIDRLNPYVTNYSVAECKEFFSGRIARWCSSRESGVVMAGLEDTLNKAFWDGSRRGEYEASEGGILGKSGAVIDVPIIYELIEDINAEMIDKFLIGGEIALMIARINIIGYGYGTYHTHQKIVNSRLS